uniref:SRCR domain-containing protein n=1 Tax=Oreochromis niloticus TaxID=8128 RepID=A0A669C7V7_ORENI
MDMNPLLLLTLLMLWSSGLQAEVKHNSTEFVRLVGGASRCAGILEVKIGEWRPVEGLHWALKEAAVACEQLDCGSALAIKDRQSSYTPVWRIPLDVVGNGSPLTEFASSAISGYTLDLTCSDSVRLLNGTSLCSGRLEVNYNQSNQSKQSWTSVCEADFDQQDAEVVCRELGCGPPSTLQGALYGDVGAPVWSKEFQCEGHESALLDCRSSNSTRSSCSPGKAVGLTCSEPIRLVGGASRCAGTLEMNLGEWRPVAGDNWALREAAVACKQLDCGSALAIEHRKSSDRPVWRIQYDFVQSGSPLTELVISVNSSSTLDLTCSDSVRLLNGPSLCSGRLEINYNQSNQSKQSWTSVCEDHFDQQDAEVVCRELGCGPPSALQGALYGDVGAPVWSKEFQCEGHESTLLDCRSSSSTRNSCSPGKAVGLTCSEPIRLVGGASRCAGTLEAKIGEWRPVGGYDWALREAAVACKQLDCGSALAIEHRKSSDRPVWRIQTDFVRSGFPLREYVISVNSSSTVDLTCSDSVRLLNGPSLCSGRLEVNYNQSNQSKQSWTSVCEADFDQQDAEVVCRELGCGPPSALQGALYGDVGAPVWSKEFQCEGHESTLLDCRSSNSTRNSCSPGKAVGLTCSEPIRLVGGASHCAGTLEMKLGEWRPVHTMARTLKEPAAFCKHLDCGSDVSVKKRESSNTPVWIHRLFCEPSYFSMMGCLQSPTIISESFTPGSVLELTCSGKQGAGAGQMGE